MTSVDQRRSAGMEQLDLALFKLRYFICRTSLASSDALAVTLSGPVNSHSQATSTRHPELSSKTWFLASRPTFRSNFAIQNSALDFGVVATLQPL